MEKEQQMINGEKLFEYKLNQIYKKFNWQKVLKTMMAVGWYWSFGFDKYGKENIGIPNLETIKNHAYYLLKQAYDEKIVISSGGFTAGWDEGEIYLRFILEEWSA